MNHDYNFQELTTNYDKKIYDFLYNEYILTKDKLSTIKKGVERFEVELITVKKIVDLIADEVYNKEKIENKKMSIKELPTNGITKKSPIVKIIAIIGYCILILLFATQVGNENFKNGFIIAFFVGIAVFVYVIVDYYNTPTDEHIFPFSLSKYFMHNLIYKILVMILAFWIPIKFNFKDGIFSLVYYGIVILTGIVFVVQLLKKTSERFRVEYGKIEYSHQIVDIFNHNTYGDDDYRKDLFRTWVYYDIHSINKIEETYNSIIIYGYIEKSITRFTPTDYRTGKTKKLDKIKITKSFKNTSNLIKALNMCVKSKDK